MQKKGGLFSWRSGCTYLLRYIKLTVLEFYMWHRPNSVLNVRASITRQGRGEGSPYHRRGSPYQGRGSPYNGGGIPYIRSVRYWISLKMDGVELTELIFSPSVKWKPQVDLVERNYRGGRQRIRTPIWSSTKKRQHCFYYRGLLQKSLRNWGGWHLKHSWRKNIDFQI